MEICAMKKLVLNNQNKTGNGRFSYSENDVMHEVTSTESIKILLDQTKKCLSYTNDELDNEDYLKLTNFAFENIKTISKNIKMYNEEQLLQLMDSFISLLLEPESVNHLWGHYIGQMLVIIQNNMPNKDSQARAIETLYYFTLHDLVKIYLKNTIFHRAIVAGIYEKEKYRHDCNKGDHIPQILCTNRHHVREFLFEPDLYKNEETRFYVPDYKTENEVYKELNQKVENGYVYLAWLYADKMVAYTDKSNYTFDNYEAIVDYKKKYEDIFFDKNSDKRYERLASGGYCTKIPTKDGKNNGIWYAIGLMSAEKIKDKFYLDTVIELVYPQSTLQYRWNVNETKELLKSLFIIFVVGIIIAIGLFFALKALFLLLAPILLGTFLDVLWNIFEAHPIMTVFGLFIIFNAFPGPILRSQLSMADIWWIKHS